MENFFHRSEVFQIRCKFNKVFQKFCKILQICPIKVWKNGLKMVIFGGPYNRGYIAASRQAIFNCVRQPRQPRYKLQVLFPGSRETRQPQYKNPIINFKVISISRLSCFAFFVFLSLCSRKTWQRLYKNYSKINFRIFISRLSCFVAAAKKNEVPPNTRHYTVPIFGRNFRTLHPCWKWTRFQINYCYQVTWNVVFHATKIISWSFQFKWYSFSNYQMKITFIKNRKVKWSMEDLKK